MKELNHRHKIFCYKYLETQNATEAYLLAGYKVKREVARRNGARLLTNADVLAFIINIQQELAIEAKVTVAQVVQQLSRIAFGNGIGDVVFVKNGEFHLRDDANFDGIKILSQKNIEGRKRKSRFFLIQAEDRLKALELLSEILGFNQESASRESKIKVRQAADRILTALKLLRK